MSFNANKMNKPGDGSSEYINLKLVGQDNEEIDFRVKMNSCLGNIKTSYAEKVGRQAGLLRFLFSGIRVQDDQTPAQLKMENDDVIEVYEVQTGGYF